jgi:hypothetical protein
MKQIADNPNFEYLGLQCFPSKCRLRAYAEAGQPTIVIATELTDNPGTSVTHAIEEIATQAWQWLERPAAGMIVIEHYEQDGKEAYAQERFALVKLTDLDGQFICPDWRYVSKEEVERWIGRKL